MPSVCRPGIPIGTVHRPVRMPKWPCSELFRIKWQLFAIIFSALGSRVAMNFFSHRPSSHFRLLAAVVLLTGSISATAVPKAAEHKDAPVTYGPEVARPKARPISAKKSVDKKAAPSAKTKPHKTPNTTKKPMTGKNRQ